MNNDYYLKGCKEVRFQKITVSVAFKKRGAIVTYKFSESISGKIDDYHFKNLYFSFPDKMEGMHPDEENPVTPFTIFS